MGPVTAYVVKVYLTEGEPSYTGPALLPTSFINLSDVSLSKLQSFCYQHKDQLFLLGQKKRGRRPGSSLNKDITVAGQSHYFNAHENEEFNSTDYPPETRALDYNDKDSILDLSSKMESSNQN